MMFPAIRCALDSLEAPGSQARITCLVRLGRTCRAGAAEFPPGAALAAVEELWQVEDEVRRQLEQEHEQERLEQELVRLEQEQIDIALERLWDQHTGTGDSD